MKSIMNIFPIEVDLPISSMSPESSGNRADGDNLRTYKGDSDETEEADDPEEDDDADELENSTERKRANDDNNLIDISNN